MDDLLELMISGSVESKINTEFGFADLLSIGKDKSVTFSLLLYLGVLTRGPKGNLRIPNEVIKTEVCVVLSWPTSYQPRQCKVMHACFI